jgi:hypothetical protein
METGPLLFTRAEQKCIDGIASKGPLSQQPNAATGLVVNQCARANNFDGYDCCLGLTQSGLRSHASVALDPADVVQYRCQGPRGLITTLVDNYRTQTPSGNVK